MSETNETTEIAVDTDDLAAFSDDFFGQKSEPAAPTKDSKAEQDPVVSDKEVPESQETTDPNDDANAEFVEEPPKKKTVQDRIDELVRQREDTKREAKVDLDRLRQEFEDYKKSANKVDVVSEKAEPTPDDTNKTGEPLYPLGEFDPQYIRDLTRYTLNTEREKANVEAEAQRQKNEINQANMALQTTWNGKLEEAKVTYPDLVEKSQTLLNGFSNLNTDYAGYLSTVLMSMDKGPDVLYYLSNHPDEAATIINSGAQKATLALGRIEAKFLDADAQKQLAKPKVSQAPPPPSERARGTNGAFVSVAPDTDNLDDFSQAFFAKKK